MADLLGSILGSMQAPPTASEQDRKKAKEEQKNLKEIQTKERKEKEKFRNEVETIISNFIKDAMNTRQRCKPMNKLKRTIVHEMCDEAGLTSQAFGQEDHDRHVMLFKREDPATDEELEAYKRGEVWDKSKQEEVKKLKVAERLEMPDTKPTVCEPSTNYRDKYNHIIGTTSAKDAAIKTEANKSFGMVPSTNKRDQRSIEETMNEIRAKKKQKT